MSYEIPIEPTPIEPTVGTHVAQPDPLAEVTAEITALKAATRPVPVLNMPDGPALSEDPIIQSSQLSALVNQEIARLHRLQVPGRLLTVSDVLSGPLHP